MRQKSTISHAYARVCAISHQRFAGVMVLRSRVGVRTNAQLRARSLLPSMLSYIIRCDTKVHSIKRNCAGVCQWLSNLCPGNVSCLTHEGYHAQSRTLAGRHFCCSSMPMYINCRGTKVHSIKRNCADVYHQPLKLCTAMGLRSLV